MIVACVDQTSTVVSIQTITDPSVDGGAAYQALSAQYQIVVDITNTFPQPGVGWTFNGSTLVTNGTTTSWKITKLAFRERFQTAELLGILEAEALGGTEGLVLQMLQENTQVADYIDLSRSDTQAGVEELVTFGLITQARATQILTTPPTASEVYTG